MLKTPKSNNTQTLDPRMDTDKHLRASKEYVNCERNSQSITQPLRKVTWILGKTLMVLVLCLGAFGVFREWIRKGLNCIKKTYT